MAIGDDATAAGYQLVPEEGEDGKVKHGARELNRTRDYVAQVKEKVPSTPAEGRTLSGIRSGTAAPTGGVDGDIYFRMV